MTWLQLHLPLWRTYSIVLHYYLSPPRTHSRDPTGALQWNQRVPWPQKYLVYGLLVVVLPLYVGDHSAQGIVIGTYDRGVK